LPALWRHSVRALWVLLAFIVIVYAVLVVLGRQLLPHLDRYQSPINDFLSERLGVEVRTQDLSGSWVRFSPRLNVEGLELLAPFIPSAPSADLLHSADLDEDGVPGQALPESRPLASPLRGIASLKIDRLSAELDLPRSILAANLIWEELSIGRASFTLIENASGKWSVEGFPEPAAGSDDDGLRRVWQMLTDSKRIRIAKVELLLRFYSGDEVVLDADDLLAENSGDFHRIAAALSMAGEEFATTLLEGHGDLLKTSGFKGRAYLSFNRIDLSGPPGIVFRGLAPEWAERIGAIKTDVAAELWLTIPKGGEWALVGRASASEIPLSWVENVPPLRNLLADLSGWFRPGLDWGLRVQGLDVDWMDTDIQPLNLEFSQQLGANWGQFTLSVDHLDLSIVSELLLKAELLPKEPENVLTALNPRGVLRDFHLDINIAEAFPLTAIYTRLDTIALDSWHGAPALKALSGYFVMKGEAGELVLDTGPDFALSFRGVYDDFLNIGSARGRVHLDVLDDGRALRIGGGPVMMKSEAGDIRAAFDLYQPLNKAAGVPIMTLIGGIRDSHSRHTEQFIPDLLQPELKAWLDEAIGDMEVKEGGFIWRGPLVGEDTTRRSIQVYARVANGNLRFDPGWPGLTQLSAYMSVDGGDLVGRVLSAKMGKARVQNTRFSTMPELPGLDIQAHVQAPLDEAIDILQHSPLQAHVAELAQWQLGGQVRADLDLGIPFSSDKRGEHYRVAARLNDGLMRLGSADIEFKHLNGEIAYDDQRGLYSEQVEFELWGEALSARLTTRENGDLDIESEGQMGLSALPMWPAFMGNWVEGSFDYQARYQIPADGTPSLRLRSDLLGVRSILPAPLNKLTEDRSDFALSLNFERDHILLEAQLNEDVAGVFKLDGKYLLQGDVALGGINAALQAVTSRVPAAEASRLSLRGSLDEFNFDQWLQVFTAPGDGRQPWDPRALSPVIDVDIGTFNIASYEIKGLTVKGDIGDDRWLFYGSSDAVAGEVRVPLENGRLALELDYLVLPSPNLDDHEGNALTNLRPDDFLELDFSTLGLRIGDDEIGEIAFSIDKIAEGIRVDNIKGELLGLSVGPTLDGTPSTLTWVEGDQPRTYFSGVLQTYDLSGVLKAADMPVILNSREAVFLTELAWAARPWEIKPALLDGSVALNFKTGKFYRSTGVTGSALIKLIGVINFDTWLRRLRFNFSDIFETGVSYDELKGSLAFNRGLMAFQPIKLKLPLGKVHLLGEADLQAETIDAHLAVTLPVGTNLPWIVALAGGLPAAAGVYITSRIFDKQVDKMSSLSYRVTGPWEDPDVKVKRIFSDNLE